MWKLDYKAACFFLVGSLIGCGFSEFAHALFLRVVA